MKLASDSTWSVQAFDEYPGLQWFALASLLLFAFSLGVTTIWLRLRIRRSVRPQAPARLASRYARGVAYPAARTEPRWFPVLDQTTEMAAVDETVVLTRAGAR